MSEKVPTENLFTDVDAARKAIHEEHAETREELVAVGQNPDESLPQAIERQGQVILKSAKQIESAPIDGKVVINIDRNTNI